MSALIDWDRLPKETPKSYAAFLAYVALGARRSVREAARQYHSKAIATGEISSAEDTTVRTWMGWSSRHKWVSRANARDAWLTRVSDEQIVANLKACHLALTTRAHGFLTANDGAEKSGSSTLADRIDLLLSALEILPLETPVDRHYGAVRQQLARQGTPIGPNDLLITAQALALDLTVVTANVQEFSRVPGLGVENWLSE